jgi:outer membrane protein assembly factor BamB
MKFLLLHHHLILLFLFLVQLHLIQPTVNQTVTFTASVSGGTGSYTYSWSGACTGSSSSCSTSFSSAGTYTANLTVTSGSETKSTSCSVTVQAPQPLPTVDLKVNNSDGPISVTLPTTITLTWTSQNASSCTASGSWSGSKSTSGSQSISLSSAGTYTYTLTCTNSSGSSSDSVTVNAQSQPSTTTQTTGEWTQFAHDPQRTSYTNQVVPPPWRWKWSWNGPDANGNPVSGKFRLPRNSQPVTGGGRVYIAAGPRGVFALNEQNGSVVWNVNPGNARIDSTPAYDPEQNALFVLSSNGVLYKLNASNGSLISSFNTGQTIPKAGFIYGGDPNQTLPLPPLIYGEKLIFSAGTKVFALNKNTMTQIWVYDSGGSPVVTPPAYSPSYNRVVVVTQDLYVHAIDGSNGTRVWRVKPTNRVYGDPGERNLNFAQAEFGWPVIAERHGLVFVKYRLDWYALYDPSHPWPADNNLIRNLLINNPHYQALFPLRLTDGSLAFIPNVSHNGWGDGGYLPMGANIVIKQFPDGTEVAYLNIRGRNNVPPDSPSGDSNFGEMVLDDTTIPGLKAGYLRWMQYGNYGWEPYSNNEVPAADEPPYLTMAGNYFLGAHWIAGYAMEIVDRSPSRGSFDNPILTRPLPHIAVVSGPGPCSNYSSYSSSHYIDGNFAACTIDGEWRALRGPGFYIYWNQGKIYDQYWSEFASWVVSNNTVYFLSVDGALVALESSVTVQAPQPLPTVDLKVNNSDGPISVTLPTTITLTWTSQNASSCTASGSWSGSKSTSGSQSISLSSAGTYTYTLTCTNSSGSSSDSVTVNAQSQPSTTTQTTGEWTQFAHDPQRTSYTNQVVPPPWRWKWSWNGPDANGNPVSGKFRLPRNSQPVTGGGRVYIAAGPRGVFALNEQDTNGDKLADVIWNNNQIGNY